MLTMFPFPQIQPDQLPAFLDCTRDHSGETTCPNIRMPATCYSENPPQEIELFLQSSLWPIVFPFIPAVQRALQQAIGECFNSVVTWHYGNWVYVND